MKNINKQISVFKEIVFINLIPLTEFVKPRLFINLASKYIEKVSTKAPDMPKIKETLLCFSDTFKYLL